MTLGVLVRRKKKQHGWVGEPSRCKPLKLPSSGLKDLGIKPGIVHCCFVYGHSYELQGIWGMGSPLEEST